jgi:glycosyltransferase A (GT-A) superfamily protein (DUF2064 family)
MNSKSAILLFSRSPYEEAEAKQFYAQNKPQKAIQLSQELRKNSLKIAQQSGLPIIDFKSSLQKGAGFGEKIVHAIQSSFESGYDNLIVIGIDSPGLNYRHIQKCRKLLEQDQNTVLGPSLDGGVYLIGINKHNFCTEEFLNLDWQTEHLQDSWKKIQSEIYWLNPLKDIDHASDLWSFTQKLSSGIYRLHQVILVILQLSIEKFLPLKIKIRKQSLSPAFGFRAPPFH